MISVGIPIRGVECTERLFGQILGRWNAIQDDRLVPCNGREEVDNLRVALINQEGVIPAIDQMALGQGLDLKKIHDHPVSGIAGLSDDVAGKRYLKHVAMPVQMPTLTTVIGNTMPGIKFQAAGDKHVELYEFCGETVRL